MRVQTKLIRRERPRRNQPICLMMSPAVEPFWALKVQLRHQVVSGVTHNGAEHTRNVTRGEGDAQLLALGALITGLGDGILQLYSA